MQEGPHQKKSYEEPPSWVLDSACPGAAEGVVTGPLQICLPTHPLCSVVCSGSWLHVPGMAHQTPATEGGCPCWRPRVYTRVCTSGACLVPAACLLPALQRTKPQRLTLRVGDLPSSRLSLPRLFKNSVHTGCPLLPGSGLGQCQ